MGPRTFNEGDLCDKETGLNSLYTDLVLNREKLNLKGKGHELSDFQKLMTVYKKWHMNFAPKLQFDFAISKVQKMGSKKQVIEHMFKLRQVYKGESEVFWELPSQDEREAPADASLLAPPTVANQFNIEKAQAQQAEKEKEHKFEMLDDETVQIDTRPKLTDEQLRIME
jgi:hypothetical protein